MHNILKTAVMAVALVTASASQAIAIDYSIKNRYIVEADGEEVGTLYIRRSSRGEGLDELQLETQLRLEFGLVAGLHEVTGDSTLRIGPNGIIRFDHRLNDNDLRFRIAGERVSDGIWVSAQRVRTLKQHEDKNFVDAALQATSSAVPFLGVAMSLVAAKGDISEAIPLAEFDLTEAELPQFIASNKTGKFSVLNTEELDINVFDLRQEGHTTVLIGDSRVEATVASVTGEHASARYWIATDALGPFIVKIEGQDQDGKYAVRLIQSPTLP
jgi:hypothetical protein